MNAYQSLTLTWLKCFFQTELGLDFMKKVLPPKPQPSVIKMAPEPLWKLASNSNLFIRMAGISGASAVVLGAYGAHC